MVGRATLRWRGGREARVPLRVSSPLCFLSPEWTVDRRGETGGVSFSDSEEDIDDDMALKEDVGEGVLGDVGEGGSRE